MIVGPRTEQRRKMETDPGNCESIGLEFSGPFTLCGENKDILFQEEIASLSGIYLWTVKFHDGFLVNYVGETGVSFFQRMKDHMIQCMGGHYRICDPKGLSEGKRIILWNGMWRKGTRDLMPVFVGKYVELAPKIKEYLELLRIFVAPLSTNARVRRRIEGAIAFSLRSQPPPVGTFMNEDVRYHRRKKDEIPIRVVLKSNRKIFGLGPEVIA